MAESILETTGAIASGDTEALARFYDTWFERLLADARGATHRDESFCLDVVHDAMMKVIKSLKPIGSEPELRCWLKTVVYRCAFDRLRSEARRLERERAAAGGLAAEARAHDDSAGTDSREEVLDRLHWLDAQLRMMNEQPAQLLTMRYRLGWTLRRIGDALGLSPGAVDGRLSRITAKMRRNALEQINE